jgi:hypothetical protein
VIPISPYRIQRTDQDRSAQKPSSRSYLLRPRLYTPLLLALSAIPCCAQSSGAATIGAPASAGLLASFATYGREAGEITAAIAAFLAILKAVGGVTSRGRKKRAQESVARLAALIHAAERFTSSKDESSILQDLISKAEADLLRAAADCYPRPKSPPRWRRILLIYLPRSPRAWLPHILFVLCCVFVILASIGAGSDFLSGTPTSDDLFAVGMALALACFSQRWAAIERRNHSNSRLEPRRLPFGLKWYPANTFLALVANSLLVWSAFSLFIPASWGAGQSQLITDPLPVWQHLALGAIACAITPVAYLWSRTEWLVFKGEISPLSPRAIFRRLAVPVPTEQVIGLLALLLLAAWCLVLLTDLPLVPRIASSPDGEVGTLGAGIAWTIVSTLILFWGAMPLLAVYRGLAELFDNRRTAPKGTGNDGN